MIIDGKELIKAHLDASRDTVLKFKNGAFTPLTPRRFIVMLDGEENSVSLDGEWRAARYPFSEAEAKLAAPETADGQWERVVQPGKVFYADPEAEAEEIPDWDRVSLKHINESDGAMLRKSADIPKSWEGKRIFLRFDAIYPAAEIYLNGKLLGRHLSGLTPFESEVTGMVKAGGKRPRRCEASAQA